MTVEVQRLTAGDARLAADAVRRLKPSGERPSELSHSSAASFLADDRNILLVALEGSEPVGYAIGYVLDRVDRESPMLLFYEIEVDRDRRRVGIGHSMVDRLRRIAGEHGACKMWVLADRENRAARALCRTAHAREVGDQLLFEWSPFDF